MPVDIAPPFFEIGPKTFLSRPELLEVADAAAEAAARFEVSVILTPPALDIEAVKARAPDLAVFAQAMDDRPVGRSTGGVLPEALKAVGADGVMLNHAERPLEAASVRRAMERAQAAGLATLVCAEDAAEATLYASWGADIVLLEPHELIGTAAQRDRPWIPRANAEVATANPATLVMHAGGIATVEDVRAVMHSGAVGTGCTSAIVKAPDRRAMTMQMVGAVHAAWTSRPSRPDGRSPTIETESEIPLR